MNIKVVNQGKDISRVIINDPKTYNSLSTKNLIDLIKVFKKLDNDKNFKSDSFAVKNNYASITPIGYHLSKLSEIQKIKDILY